MYGFLAHLGEQAEAEDLTQETYLRALPGFAGRSSARTWLLSIARRVAADQIRRSRSRPRTTAVQEWDTIVAASPAQRRSGLDEACCFAS